ncbi:hypothetical protein F1559_004959 [Cyanidiococcus yangmingshanensis]|uniref:Uncharacterized protein n=1 Tax=Cyanidiococcus yangmingshanensis TaxID=2690220 RepID=A0A7J7IQ26_9RHOD|nr:hypothetical protein F1559_004959 [Cyanidiococcus yangmingshanensis]
MNTPRNKDCRVVLPDESVITAAVNCFQCAVDEALRPSVRETYLLPSSRRELVRKELDATAAALAPALAGELRPSPGDYTSPSLKKRRTWRNEVNSGRSSLAFWQRRSTCVSCELSWPLRLSSLITTQAERLARQIEHFQARMNQVDVLDEDSASEDEAARDEHNARRRTLEEEVQRRLDSLQTLIAELHTAAERLREVAQSFGDVAPSETELVIREDLKSLLSLDPESENAHPEPRDNNAETKAAPLNKDPSGVSTRARLAAALRAQGTAARIR